MMTEVPPSSVRREALAAALAKGEDPEAYGAARAALGLPPLDFNQARTVGVRAAEFFDAVLASPAADELTSAALGSWLLLEGTAWDFYVANALSLWGAERGATAPAPLFTAGGGIGACSQSVAADLRAAADPAARRTALAALLTECAAEIEAVMGCWFYCLDSRPTLAQGAPGENRALARLWILAGPQGGRWALTSANGAPPRVAQPWTAALLLGPATITSTQIPDEDLDPTYPWMRGLLVEWGAGGPCLNQERLFTRMKRRAIEDAVGVRRIFGRESIHGD